ncbi:MAG: tetratricopeptide repeat protein [Sphingobacteriales bacterium]|nr:tetratricopeptide repeat protein [Sphingobacteriales bacterium]
MLAVAVLLLYSMALFNGFTNWDDTDYVLQNPYIGGLSATHLQAMFKAVVSSNYHPLTLLSLAIDNAIWKQNPFGYHLTNVLLHLANTLFVFEIVRRWRDTSLQVAGFAALCFAIHPLHVESVAWISERKDVLYAFFMLPALWCYGHYLKKQQGYILIVAFLLFVLSVLSKPSGVILPVLLCWLACYEDKLTWRNFLVTFPFWVVAVAMGIITLKTQSTTALGDMQEVNLWQRLCFGAYGYLYYAFKLFFPFHLAAYHPYPDLSKPLEWYYWLSPVVLAVLLGAVQLSGRSTRFGWWWYGINLALMVQWVAVGSAVVAERYTYIAYIGVFWWLGQQATYIIAQKSAFKKWLLPLMLLLLLLYAVQTWRYIPLWSNSEVLWTNVLHYYPDNMLAYHNRGLYYSSVQEGEKALADYNRAIAIQPYYAPNYFNRAKNYHLILNNPSAALTDYEKSLSLQNRQPEVWYHLGNLYAYHFKNTEKALACYEQVLSIDPQHVGAWNNRGTLYLQDKKDYKRALADFNKAIALAPNDGTYYYNRFICYYMLGNTAAARENIVAAKRLGYAVPAQYWNEMGLSN